MMSSIAAVLLVPLLLPAPQEPTPVRREAPDPVARTLVVYDVRDLLERITGAVPVAAARPPVAGADDFEDVVDEFRGLGRPEEREIAREVARYEATLRHRKLHESNLAEIARLLRVFGRPEFGDTARIDVAGDGHLAVATSPGHHAWLRKFFAAERAAAPATWIEISCVLISGPKGSFEKAGMALTATYPTEAERDAMLAGLRGRDFTVVTQPRLTAVDMQEASISLLNPTSYVKEFHIQYVEPERQAIADPVVDVIHEGVICRTRALTLPEDEIGLHLDLETIEVKRPIRTRRVRLAPGMEHEGTVSDPEVLRMRFSTDARLADGASASFLTALRDDTDMALFVTVRKASPAGGVPERR